MCCSRFTNGLREALQNDIPNYNQLIEKYKKGHFKICTSVIFHVQCTCPTQKYRDGWFYFYNIQKNRNWRINQILQIVLEYCNVSSYLKRPRVQFLVLIS